MLSRTYVVLYKDDSSYRRKCHFTATGASIIGQCARQLAAGKPKSVPISRLDECSALTLAISISVHPSRCRNGSLLRAGGTLTGVLTAERRSPYPPGGFVPPDTCLGPWRHLNNHVIKAVGHQDSATAAASSRRRGLALMSHYYVGTSAFRLAPSSRHPVDHLGVSLSDGWVLP